MKFKKKLYVTAVCAAMALSSMAVGASAASPWGSGGNGGNNGNGRGVTVLGNIPGLGQSLGGLVSGPSCGANSPGNGFNIRDLFGGGGCDYGTPGCNNNQGSCDIGSIIGSIQNGCGQWDQNCGRPDCPNGENGQLPNYPDQGGGQLPDIGAPDLPGNPGLPDNNNPGNGDQNGNASYVRQVVDLVNKERKAAGLSALEADFAVQSAAQVRAREIQTSFSHTRPNGASCFTALSEAGVNYRSAGENIAYGQKTPEEVMRGWMNSEGHRANIMNANFKYIGVGCYQGSDGTLYWSQFFTA